MMTRREFLELAALAGVQVTGGGALAIERDRQGAFVWPRLVNRGRTPIVVNDVVVFEEPLTVPLSSALYGEGFQMLTQTAGTLANRIDLSQYTDARHYRIPGSTGAYYGLMTITPDGDWTRLYAFTSCV